MEEIFTFLLIAIGIIIAFLFGRKSDHLFPKKEEQNWRPIQGKPDYVEIWDNNNWKKIKLPKDKEGKQIKNDKVKEIEISNKGEMNVKIIEGATNRRDIINNRNK